MNRRCIALLGLLLGCSGPDTPAPSEASPPQAVSPPDVAPAPTPAPEGLWFVEGAEDAGMDMLHHSGESSKRWMPEIMGSGVAIADFDRNGAPDLFFSDGGRIEMGETRPPSARNRLFLGDGRGALREAGEAWAVPSRGYGQGVAVGDIDNDGYPDVYVATWEGHDQLLRNTGSGFQDITAASGIPRSTAWASSAAFLDADGDGNLDLYIAYYSDYTRTTANDCFGGGVRTYCNPVLHPPLPDRILRGRGDGTFEEMSEAWGVSKHRTRSLAIAAGDIDGDGDTDIYVASDLTRNLLFVNDGTGVMTDRARAAGVAYSSVGAEEAGMGADFSDYDGDGLVDITCANFQTQATSIYRQSDPGFFIEQADAIGVGSASRARLTFGIDWFDADNDGDEDLLMANGHIYPEIADRRKEGGFAQGNTLFENLGNGRFAHAGDSAGPALQRVAVSRGLATGDLDGDGDLDFVVTDRDAPAQLGRNESAAGGFLNLHLEGTETNRSAIGTRVEATIGDRTIRREVMGAQSYLSVSDLRVHLGLGDATQVDTLVIRWHRGEAQTFEGVEGNRFLRVVQGLEPQAYVPGAGLPAP